MIKNKITYLLGADMIMSVKISNITWEEKDENNKVIIPFGGSKKLEFSVKEVMAGKKEIEKNGLMLLVEEYLNIKTPEFRERLFKEYQIASDTIDGLALESTVEPLNVQLFHRVLDLIDYEELAAFLATIVQVPKDLKDEFVADADNMLNETQTYTKREYLELIVLSTFLKTTLPLLGKYMQVKSYLVNKNFKEYIFITVYDLYPKIARLEIEPKESKIEKTEKEKFEEKIEIESKSKNTAYTKLYKFCAKAYERDRNSENDSVRAIIYGIPKDETVKWLFASSVILAVASVSTINDTVAKNIITKIFNSILKSKVQKDTTRTPIKNKADTLSSKGGEETQESKSESYRITTSIMPGYVEEINWAAEDPDFIFKQLHSYLNIDIDLANMIYNKLLSYSKGEAFIVPDSTFVIIGWAMHGYLLHIDALKHLRRKNLYAVIAITYSHLYINGFKDLALTIVSKTPGENDIGFNNNATNRTKLSEALKEELDSFYLVKKNRLTVKESLQESSIAEMGINALSEMLFAETFISLAPVEHLKEVKGNASPVVVMGTDLKVRLAEFLIFINNRKPVINLPRN